MRAILTASPDYAPFARRELDARLPAGSSVEALGAGIWLVSCPGRFRDVAADLAHTVFVRHASPVDVEVPVDPDGSARQWAWNRLAPALACERLPRPLQVQTRILPGGPVWAPGPLAAEVRAALAARGADVATGPVDGVLSVAVGAAVAYAGAAGRAASLSPWPGGAVRLRRPPDEISRSARKLEEALLAFDIALPAGAAALDLGASPGGWSQLLLRRGMAVTAVDPGLLDARLAGQPGLTFLRGSALRVPLPAGPFRFITADLNWEPLRAAACVNRFHPCLVPGAAGVFTVKFFGRDPLFAVTAVREALGRRYRVVAVRHLYHNRSEATAHLRA